MSIQGAQASKSLWGSFTNWASKVQQFIPSAKFSPANGVADKPAVALKKLEQRQELNFTPLDSELAKILATPNTEVNACVSPSTGGPEPKLVAKETDVTAGELKVNDAYDLSLYQLPDGNYRLDLSMKLQFFFEDGSGGQWTEKEKIQYVQDWQKCIKSVWDGRSFSLDNGKKVELNIDFDTQIEGWMADHWELTVDKIKPGFVQTSVTKFNKGNVYIDSEDLKFFTDGGPSQRGSVHEFGHMLGLEDEYFEDSPHYKDRPSVMNYGEKIEPRHLEFFKSWVTEKLAN